MDRRTVAYNGKQTRQEVIAPEGSHVLKGITPCLFEISCR